MILNSYFYNKIIIIKNLRGLITIKITILYERIKKNIKEKAKTLKPNWKSWVGMFKASVSFHKNNKFNVNTGSN